MRNTIVINYSFQIRKEKELVQEETKEYQIVDSGEDSIITCNMNENQIKDFKGLINKIIEKSNDQNLLVMLHKGNEVLEINIKEISADHNLIKIREFGGGSNAGHPIYYNSTNSEFGLLKGSKLHETAIKMISKSINKIKKENFDFVWNWYWNKLELNNLKKEIINLWLPMGIDMQGLSEIYHSNIIDKQEKINIYIKEIYSDIEKYANNHKSKWEEIKKILLPEQDSKEVLDEKYRLTGIEKNKVKFPVEDIKTDNLINFIEENYKDTANPNFLPNWLQEVAKILDDKIKTQNLKD